MNTRLPNLFPGDATIEREVAQTKDPFPLKNVGPDVGFRPPDFRQKRSEALQAKDNHFTWNRPRITPADPFSTSLYGLPPVVFAGTPVGPAPGYPMAPSYSGYPVYAPYAVPQQPAHVPVPWVAPNVASPLVSPFYY